MTATWNVEVNYIAQWFASLSSRHQEVVAAAIRDLEADGPGLGRPLVGEVKGSSISNLKELRPNKVGGDVIRVLFAFAPDRSGVLLFGGIKGNQKTDGTNSKEWKKWYKKAIAESERNFADYNANRK